MIIIIFIHNYIYKIVKNVILFTRRRLSIFASLGI